ncbi:hypothetical protein SGRA_0019 [Saprospira grandis str. Lewin]|uniref:Uncharacterized protein n=1 Tax=Saprospira grandis (strain Lewin) TaxID=984262 RepID=H6L3S9_SAPGL|nr:hypothetical protein SGRA_0019 [Saprospira grandis str. Lewin]
MLIQQKKVVYLIYDVFWGLPALRAGRAVSQLAGLLGPSAALPPRSGLRPLLSIPKPAALRACKTQLASFWPNIRS